jgi:hypothetical protein
LILSDRRRTSVAQRDVVQVYPGKDFDLAVGSQLTTGGWLSAVAHGELKGAVGSTPGGGVPFDPAHLAIKMAEEGFCAVAARRCWIDPNDARCSDV